MKILLADDHTLFREGMRHVLRQLEEGTQVFEAGNCEEALETASGHPDLDLVLLDLNMPGVTGIDAVNLFRQRFPELPIVVLSAMEDHDDVEKVLDAGALGFVPKSSSVQVMLQALRLVLAGGVYLPPLLLSRASSRARGPVDAAPPSALDPEGRIEGLTDRQHEVLQLLAQGKPNKLIARALNVSEGTVKVHLAAIFRVLNVNNRVEAVVAAQRMLTSVPRG